MSLGNCLKIDNYKIGDGNSCFIMAEAGVNHQGSLTKAKALVDIAAEAGADAVKFQHHIPDEEMICHPISESLYKSISATKLDINQLKELRDYANSKGLVFLCTPFSLKAATELVGLVPAFKIGSGELNNYPFLEAVAKLGKPLILSTGMSMLSEIEMAIERIKPYTDFALMVCVSKYPAHAQDFDLTRIKFLKEKFQCPVGISDHCIDNHISFAAVAMGANVIEKHFTLSCKLKGDDHHMSLESDELKDLVRGIRAIGEAVKPKLWVLSPEDLEMRLKYNHSIISVRDITKGEKIGTSNVWPKRPGIGIPAMYLDMVAGMKTKRDIKKDILIKGIMISGSKESLFEEIKMDAKQWRTLKVSCPICKENTMLEDISNQWWTEDDVDVVWYKCKRSGCEFGVRQRENKRKFSSSSSSVTKPMLLNSAEKCRFYKSRVVSSNVT